MNTRTSALCALTCWALIAQDNSLDQAWTAAAKGDRSTATIIARAVVKREPQNADAHLLLGSLLIEAGAGAEAVDQIKEAARLRPNSAEAWDALGEAYNAWGKPREARKPFERAVQLDPKFAVAQSHLGAALLQAGDSGDAARHLDRAIELLGHSPDAADAHYLRSKIYNSMGQTSEAKKHLEEAVKLQPSLGVAWSDLGEISRLQLDSAGALAAFEQAVQLGPEDAVAQYRLGAELLRADQLTPGLAHLEAAYKLAPTDQSTLNALQNALRLAGQPVEAAHIKQVLADVLRTRDQKSQANLKALILNNEGSELERSGNLIEAADKYREALKLNPDHNGIRVNHATALLRLGRWTEGLEELHDALEKDSDNREIQLALKDALSQSPRELLPAWAKATAFR